VDLAEAGLGLEDRAPELVEVALGELLLGRGLNVGLLINGVKLTALGGVKQDLGGLLDALEEVVVIDAAGSSLLIGVVLQDLLAVGLLDLLLGGLPAVLGEAENLVVILRLVIGGMLVKEPNHDRINANQPSSPWHHAGASSGPRAR
jgi:hypothetical protein